MEHDALQLHPGIAAALQEHRPVVALESTVITHGLPYPANLETALAMEEAVRAGGAVPATIAILHGV
jgi:pseudouridylate synthase